MEMCLFLLRILLQFGYSEIGIYVCEGKILYFFIIRGLKRISLIGDSSVLWLIVQQKLQTYGIS